MVYPKEGYFVDRTMAMSSKHDPCCLVYYTDTPSHETWVALCDRMDDMGYVGLDEIADFVREQYQARFAIYEDYWWFRFPDVETRTQFEMTWHHL